MYALSGASLSVDGLGVTEHRLGSHGVMALCNLALANGNIARPGTGINPLRGQNNVQGASDSGCLPAHFVGINCSMIRSCPPVTNRSLGVLFPPAEE